MDIMTYKVILLGDSGTGKSTYMYRLCKAEIMHDCPKTIGVDFMSVAMKVRGTNVKTHIWDTSGQSGFRYIVKSYYRDAIGALIFFDINSLNSLMSTEVLLRDLLEKRKDISTPCTVMLIGHKCDQNSRIVDSYILDHIERLKTTYGVDLKYCEVSSMKNMGVRDSMDTLVNAIHDTNKVNRSKSETTCHCTIQ